MKKIIERKILKEIREYYDVQEMVVLIGSRQVGKSTLLHMIQSEIMVDEYGIFLDADFNSELLLLNSSKGLVDILELSGYKKRGENTFVVCIDEFQKIKNIGTIIKGIYDRYSNIKFFLSGSSSILINKAFGDSMMGRKVVFNIEKLDFEEFLKFSGNIDFGLIYKKISLGQDISFYGEDFKKMIEKFLLFGGYPQIVLSSNDNYKIKKLEEIVNSYIQKDILEFFQSEHSNNIIRLLKYLTQVNSNFLKKSAISNTLGISNYNIGKYISVLEETFLIKSVDPFFTNKIKSISKTQEVFFTDVGIYNSILKNFNELDLRTDKGIVVENFVYSELMKTKDILSELYFYRDKNQLEVDFIIKRGNTLLPIEVKSGDYTKIPANIKNFSNKNNIHLAVLINKSCFKTEEKDGLKVVFIPYFLTGRLFDLIENIK